MRIGAFLRDKLSVLVTFLLSTMAVGFFLWIIDVRKIFILYLLLLYMIPFGMVLTMEYIKKKSYYKRMEQLLGVLESKTLLPELIEDADFLDGRLLKDYLGIAAKYMNDKIALYDTASKEYKEYVEMWVHEIKTPITVIRLLLENHPSPLSKEIEAELFSVEDKVEQALFYARCASVEKDFMIKQIPLKDLVDSALKKNAKALIGARAKIEQEYLEWDVYADTKWIDFILGQIISNAIKYRKESMVLRFRGEQQDNYVCLQISDNGLGILEEDLGRIFEKGFTGSNGRKEQRSTGMGLYICQKLANKMNLRMYAESVQGEGTTITIVFPVGSMTEVTLQKCKINVM